MDKITLAGIAVYGCHGAMEEERRLGQRFYIDAELSLDLSRAAETDALSDTVNYAEVYEKIRKIAEGEPFRLIEKLAGEIGREILADYPAVSSARITVHKPSAPIPGILSDVAVTVESAR